MWIESLAIGNIRSFEQERFVFTREDGKPHRWVTLLGENGGGKSTVLQALGLLLAGAEGARALVPRPVGWLRDESNPGGMTMSFRQGSKDPGKAKTRSLNSSAPLAS
jgi:energy-coupling factor transporter ATP-binding protein EcfA2